MEKARHVYVKLVVSKAVLDVLHSSKMKMMKITIMIREQFVMRVCVLLCPLSVLVTSHHMHACLYKQESTTEAKYTFSTDFVT